MQPAQRGALRYTVIVSLTLFSLTSLAGCLEEIKPSPLPPLEEAQSFDGSFYEPPQADEIQNEGYGYGSSGAYSSGLTDEPEATPSEEGGADQDEGEGGLP